MNIRHLFIICALFNAASFSAHAAPSAAVVDQSSSLNPLKVLSLRSMILGGGGLTAGGIAFGLRMWRNKLRKDLQIAKEIASNPQAASLDKFLADYRVISLQEDLVSLTRYSKWLAWLGAGLGVATVGSVGFDYGKSRTSAPASTPGAPIIRYHERCIEVPGPVRNVMVPEQETIAASIKQRAEEFGDMAVELTRFGIRDDMSLLEQVVRNNELAKMLYNKDGNYLNRRLKERTQAMLEGALGIPLDERAREESIISDPQKYVDEIVCYHQMVNRVHGYHVFPEDRATIMTDLYDQMPETAGIGSAGQASAKHTLQSILPGGEPILNIERLLFKWANDDKLVAHVETATQELIAALATIPQEQKDAYAARVQARLVVLEQRLEAVTAARAALEAMGEQIAADALAEKDQIDTLGGSEHPVYGFWDMWQTIAAYTQALPTGDDRLAAQLDVLANQLYGSYTGLIDRFIAKWQAPDEEGEPLALAQAHTLVRAIPFIENMVTHTHDARYPRARELKTYLYNKLNESFYDAGSLWSIRQDSQDVPSLVKFYVDKFVEFNGEGNLVQSDLSKVSLDAVRKILENNSIERNRVAGHHDEVRLVAQLDAIYDRILGTQGVALETLPFGHQKWWQVLERIDSLQEKIDTNMHWGEVGFTHTLQDKIKTARDQLLARRTGRQSDESKYARQIFQLHQDKAAGGDIAKRSDEMSAKIRRVFANNAVVRGRLMARMPAP